MNVKEKAMMEYMEMIGDNSSDQHVCNMRTAFQDGWDARDSEVESLISALEFVKQYIDNYTLAVQNNCIMDKTLWDVLDVVNKALNNK
jgi:hypothetical protein